MTLWSDDLPLTVTINGVVVGSNTQGNIASASFGAGRRDWFDSLSPGTGTFTLKDMTRAEFQTLIGSASPLGKTVVVSCDSTLWTGRVDTVTEVPVPGEPTSLTVTAVDQVALLGQARLEDEELDLNRFENQIVDVFGFAGLSPTVQFLPIGTGATLGGIDPLSGSVLEWLGTAEKDANAIVAPRGDGSILVCYRGTFSDYGYRATGAGYYVSTGANSFWRMDESSGNLEDSGADEAERTLTASGTPTYGATGPWGPNGPKAISFTKSDAADQFVGGDSFDLAGQTAWTIMGWVRWSGDSSSRSTILSKIAAGPSGWLLQVGTGGEVRYQALDGGSVLCNILTSAGTLTANTWHHVAVRLLSGSVAVFVDGEVAGGPTALGGALPNTAASLRFGSNAGSSEWMDGRLCMWAIWNTTALLQGQIRSLIDLDHVVLEDDLEPFAWTEELSITTVINHWIFRQFGGVDSYTNSGSIAAYGDRSFEVESEAISSLADRYSSALRATLDEPRPIVNAGVHIQGSAQQDLVTVQPLDYVVRDGRAWQIMSVQHEVSPDRWDITMSLAGTVADLTGTGAVLPNPPD